MIQVCSSCGTRWNVRDQRREWCPRCRGALLDPAGSAADPAGSATPATPVTPAAPARPGYRWIAVRPGAPPRPRRRRVELGPTPRYQHMPRWTLPDPPPVVEEDSGNERTRLSARGIEIVARVALAALLGAAAAYLLRYLLMVINRTVLIYPVVAIGANLLAVVGAVVAMLALLALAVVLAGWLIRRRESSFAARGEKDPREPFELWVGCLVPIWNLFWAPVYVIELDGAEACYHRFRRPILRWWLLWVASAVVSVGVMAVTAFALETGYATDAQGIADTTLGAIVAYLLAAATVWALMRVFRDFEVKPVDRPLHRWVVAGDGVPAPQPGAEAVPAVGAVPNADTESADVEPTGAEPVGAERVA